MPWTNVTYIIVTSREEINRFVIRALSGRFTVTERCEQFGISRKTGYKPLERYAALGLGGLPPRSHRPHHSPPRTDGAVEALILAFYSPDAFAPVRSGSGGGEQAPPVRRHRLWLPVARLGRSPRRLQPQVRIYGRPGNPPRRSERVAPSRARIPMARSILE